MVHVIVAKDVNDADYVAAHAEGSLALIAGHIDGPRTRLHPLCGQNNVQGSSNASPLTMLCLD